VLDFKECPYGIPVGHSESHVFRLPTLKNAWKAFFNNLLSVVAGSGRAVFTMLNVELETD
jgi:hypothetical protein